MFRTKFWFMIASMVLLSLSAGCLSLAEDITPPPGAELPPPAAATPIPQITDLSGENVYPANRPDPQEGASIYLEKCAPCHGEKGLGDGPDAEILENPVPALGSAEVARKSAPVEWYRIVTMGNMENFMPPFSSLSDQERWDVVAYLYTLSAPTQTTEQGETLFLENCAECHGEDGKQGSVDLTEMTTLGERTAEEIAAFIKTGHEEMPPFDLFNEDQLWALTAYLRSLAFAPAGGFSPEISEQGNPGQDEMASTDGEAPSLEPLPGDDGSGNVNVNILNASESTLPNELEITLRGYDDMVEVYTQTLRLTESEVVRFDDIPLPLERMYFATIEYNNAVYGSDVLVVEPDSPDELNLEITYYAPTTDTSVLQVDRLHVFLSFADEQTLEIFQLYIFSNPTNQVLVPEGNGVAVDFSIPADASNLFVEDTMSMAYKKTGNGFGIVNIYPGETPYQTVFSYQIPYAERNLDLSIPISMDANAVIVMAPAGSLKVKSSQLEDAGSRDFEGISYNMYTGVNLETGKTLELSLSGRPDTAANIFSFNGSSNTSLIIGLAGLGGALIISGIILWYRNRGAEVVEDEWEEEFNGESPEDVMDAIINLDDQYRMGGLPEGAYRVRREELKERLKKIIRNE